MRRLILTVCLAALAGPAVAQEGRFVDPAPVNFDRPFQYDGLRVREGVVVQDEGAPPVRAQGIPIEVWLANGRTLKGLNTREGKPAVNVEDGEALRELFKDLLPVETPQNPAPNQAR